MLGNLGNYELSAGDLDAARRHLAESLDIARAFSARSDIVYETFNLGLAEYLGGSPSAAGALFAESFDLARRTGMRAASAYALLGLAMAGHGGATGGPTRAGPPGCTARPTRPWRIWATPSSRWKPGWPTATASGCVPRWAPGPSRPNTPRAAPSTWRGCWLRSGARTQRPSRRVADEALQGMRRRRTGRCRLR